jgi:cholesterol oxidase
VAVASRLGKRRYRAAVVGTGFGGAIAACRLAQAGIDVAVLERGRRYPPGSFPRDVVGDDGLLWHRGAGLYDIRPLNDMLVVQAAGYGGGSLVYANVQFRPPPDLFEDGWPAPYSRDTPANLQLYAAEAAACGEVAAELGGRLTLPAPWRYLGQPVSVHNLGGCRMADDPALGVVDADGRVFGYAGLHVLDGAILPTATGANPSATIAAVAERCIEQAIRRMTGDDAWKAPEAPGAHRRALPEDGVVVPRSGTPPVRAPSGGVRNVETMHGEAPVQLGEDDAGPARRFRFSVTSTAVDVRHFLADPTHPTTLSGTVWVDGLTGTAGAPVVGGTFHLFPDTDDPLTRLMSYTVPFRPPDDGRLWVVQGRKVVGGHRIRDRWRALTTMPATVRPAEGSPPAQSGVAGWARIDTANVARMLASFRVIGGDGRLGVARGLLSFYRFFGLTVARLYVAGIRARWRAGRRP